MAVQRSASRREDWIDLEAVAAGNETNHSVSAQQHDHQIEIIWMLEAISLVRRVTEVEVSFEGLHSQNLWHQH